jgi:hypothetical protein
VEHAGYADLEEHEVRAAISALHQAEMDSSFSGLVNLSPSRKRARSQQAQHASNSALVDATQASLHDSRERGADNLEASRPKRSRRPKRVFGDATSDSE